MAHETIRKVTELVAEGTKFYIVKRTDIHPGTSEVRILYCAIDEKYVDENGCLNKELNGLQMHARKTLDECINEVISVQKAKKLMEQGVDEMDAIMISLGLK